MNNPHDVPQSWEDLDDLLGQMREQTSKLDKAKAKRDAEVAVIAQEHADKIETLTTILAVQQAKVEVFLSEHRAEFPAPGEEGRFKDLIHGRVGFRQATPKLATLRGLTEDEVVEFMLTNKRRFERYLRIRTALDKSSILSEMPAEVMEEVGLAVQQDDNSFCSLKKG